MTDEERSLASNRLSELRTHILAERDDTADDSTPVELDQARVGRLSRMDDMQQQAMAVEQKRRREIRLKRIEGAFLRIDKGTYGACVKCGQTIPPERMDFDPTVFFCTECATAAEKA